MCVQLAMHMQWGPVSVVCSRHHMHVPVPHVSVMHIDIVLPTTGRHTQTAQCSIDSESDAPWRRCEMACNSCTCKL